MAEGAGIERAAMRLDKFLWYARLARTRSVAQGVAEARHLRLNGRVIDRSAAGVRVGDTLTFPLHGHVRVIRVAALPTRRGPVPEARACYADLSPMSVAEPIPFAENVSQEAAGD